MTPSVTRDDMASRRRPVSMEIPAFADAKSGTITESGPRVEAVRKPFSHRDDERARRTVSSVACTVETSARTASSTSSIGTNRFRRSEETGNDTGDRGVNAGLRRGHPQPDANGVDGDGTYADPFQQNHQHEQCAGCCEPWRCSCSASRRWIATRKNGVIRPSLTQWCRSGVSS